MTGRVGLAGLALASLACGACSLLVEPNPEFVADEDTSSSDTSATETADESESTDTDQLMGGEPPQPAWLTVYTIGNPDDATVDPIGPGLLLIGGPMPSGASGPLDTAYQWQADSIAGGDIVILQNSGDAVLNNYLYQIIGGADSVQTIIVPPGAASMEPWIAWTLATAEAVLIVGSGPYGLNWKNTPIEFGIMAAWDRGAVIGGVDAGLSTLGEFVDPGYGGLLTSAEALADPYGPNVVLERGYLSLELLDNALIEPSFANDNRMGRLLAFAARVLEDGLSDRFVGLGIDQNTALVIGPDGLGIVHGEGHVYIFRAEELATVCAPGEALEFGPVMYHRLVAGNTAGWPGGQTAVPGMPLSAFGGVTEPVDPY
jgi:cyanophycinase